MVPRGPVLSELDGCLTQSQPYVSVCCHCSGALCPRPHSPQRTCRLGWWPRVPVSERTDTGQVPGKVRGAQLRGRDGDREGPWLGKSCSANSSPPPSPTPGAHQQLQEAGSPTPCEEEGWTPWGPGTISVRRCQMGLLTGFGLVPGDVGEHSRQQGASLCQTPSKVGVSPAGCLDGERREGQPRLQVAGKGPSLVSQVGLRCARPALDRFLFLSLQL